MPDRRSISLHCPSCGPVAEVKLTVKNGFFQFIKEFGNPFSAYLFLDSKIIQVKKILVGCIIVLIIQPATAQKTASIDSLLSGLYPRTAPGAAVMISRNGRVLFEKAYGVSDLGSQQPNTVSTNFNIGSVTKQFTAYCILELVTRKKLSLDDPLTRFFPGFHPVTGKITVRQLLSHCSGIADHYGFTDTNRVKRATDKDVLEAVQQAGELYFAPGTHYRYSNTAYCLLGMIIERVSGQSYAAYIRQHIFEPLHMAHSSVLQMGQPIAKRAIGYDYDSATGQFLKLDEKESIFFSTEADGGIYTSLEDYAKWLQFLAGAGKTRIQQAQSPQFPVDSLQKLFYGYGWFVSDKGPSRAVYHSGSNGGFRAFIYTIPSKKYQLIIFSNRTGVDLEELVKRLNELAGITNNSFTKIETLVSFHNRWPIFAPCKETRLFSI